ncbi:MAG: tetratricopeptide repeat protein [candidate division Zixibacteria bacterium]|nr:tetratricopeptide repeat protein [candidate division Zixibacteria bacterium]
MRKVNCSLWRIVVVFGLLAVICGNGSLYAQDPQDAEKGKESFNQAITIIKTGDTAGAVVAYQGAIKMDPTMSDAYLNLGSIYFAQNNLEKAAENFQKVTELTPTNAVGFLNYGKVLTAQKKLDLALAAYQSAQQIDPSNLEIEKEIGKTNFKLGKMDDCIASLEKYVKGDSTDGYSYYLMGMASKKKKNDAKAMEYFKTAINRNPDDFESVYNLGNIYLGKADWSNARTQYEKGMQLKSKDYRCANNLALVIEQGNPGKTAMAIEAWEKFLTVAKKNPKAAELVSKAEEHLKQLKEAQAAGQ